MVVYIKNMVCPRCITAVQHIFDDLSIPVKHIQLGKVEIHSEFNKTNKKMLKNRLDMAGFELIEDKNHKLIEQIKNLIIQQIHHSTKNLSTNFSTYLSSNLHQDYGSLSRLFSSVEGVTIEKYILRQKIERVKELLFYNDLTLSEIAHQLGYSSVAHLSSQFKKEIGMPPSEFKKLKGPTHRSIDSI